MVLFILGVVVYVIAVASASNSGYQARTPGIAEPLDTIRRVNADIESMTVDELQRARITLDQYFGSTTRTDVREARRRQAREVARLPRREPSGAPGTGATPCA